MAFSQIDAAFPKECSTIVGSVMTTLLGVYCGNDTTNVEVFESWLGRDVDFVTVFTGETSWADFDGSPNYEGSLFKKLHCPINWSIPLVPAGVSLSAAAGGACNLHYTRAAKEIAERQNEKVIYVRTGWEQNGNWMKWAAQGKEAAYIGAFRAFAACFRSVSPRFRIVWCPNIGQNDPEPSYPGDRFVDVIGMDVYHDAKWDPSDPLSAWSYMVTRRFGLQWHLQFSKAHGKPMAYPEWGVRSNNFGSYVERMAQWFTASAVLYQSYWNSDAAYPGRLSSGHYPDTANAFLKAFR